MLPTKDNVLFQRPEFSYTRLLRTKLIKKTVANFKDLQMCDRKVMLEIQLSKTFNECIE